MGFATPLGLLGLLLLLPLAWLYLRVRERPPLAVSTLRLWDDIPEPPEPRRRPKLPLRFFLQAALLAALALALAEPWRAGAPDPSVAELAAVRTLILDTSASMRTREGDSSRFDLAREKALQRLKALEAAGPARFSVVLSAGRDTVVVESGDAAQARRALEQAEAQAFGGQPTAAIEAAAAALGERDSIDVFTDTPAEALVLSREARQRAQIHATGAGGSNFSITDLATTLGRLGGGEARALVTVRNHNNEAGRVRLVLEPLTPEQGDDARHGAEPGTAAADPGKIKAGAASSSSAVLKAPVTKVADAATAFEILLEIPARQTARTSIGPVAWRGPFTVRLLPAGDDAALDEGTPDQGTPDEGTLDEGTPDEGNVDDFSLDDVAYGVFVQPHAFRLRLVTRDAALGASAKALAKAHGGIELELSRDADATSPTSPDVTLFDREVPKKRPRGNVAYLAPAHGNEDVRIAGSLHDAGISDSSAHPLLSATATPEILLDLSGRDVVEIIPDTRLSRVLSARAEGREISLLQAGELEGRRVVLSGFRLPGQVLDSADGVPALVFLVDLLHWLTPPPGNAPVLPASFRDPAESEIGRPEEAAGSGTGNESAAALPILVKDTIEETPRASPAARLPMAALPLGLALLLLVGEWLLLAVESRQAVGSRSGEPS